MNAIFCDFGHFSEKGGVYALVAWST
jgi:hypothetical protein